MSVKPVLLIYKKSAYSIYQQQNKAGMSYPAKSVLSDKIRRMVEAHNEHYKTLVYVESVLKKYKIPYVRRLRKRPINYNQFQYVLTVGGDGTFLETARFLKKQWILGINSSPNFSIGKLCHGSLKNFEAIIARLSADRVDFETLQRIRIQYDSKLKYADSLNEVLVANFTPAIMCRYFLSLKGQSEEQYGSGLWIATPSGSTGAIRSAGGKIMDRREKKYQYLPRELNRVKKPHYQLTGGVLQSHQKISIVSFMQNGRLYIDGNHLRIPFKYGTKIQIGLSPYPLKSIILK